MFFFTFLLFSIKLSPSILRDSQISRKSHDKDKDLSDLERKGLLDWTESEGSDGESLSIRNQRLQFLKQLNQYGKKKPPPPPNQSTNFLIILPRFPEIANQEAEEEEPLKEKNIVKP